MDLTILDTIREVLSEVQEECPYEELFLVVGKPQLEELKAIINPDWFFLSIDELGGRKMTIFGIPVVCVPDYDGVKIVHAHRTPLFG